MPDVRNCFAKNRGQRRQRKESRLAKRTLAHVIHCTTGENRLPQMSQSPQQPTLSDNVSNQPNSRLACRNETSLCPQRIPCLVKASSSTQPTENTGSKGVTGFCFRQKQETSTGAQWDQGRKGHRQTPAYGGIKCWQRTNDAASSHKQPLELATLRDFLVHSHMAHMACVQGDRIVVLGVDSFQPSFFPKTGHFPWVSGGFLEGRISGKNGIEG